MRHWRHVGQPYLTVIGLAALVGLIAGVLWVVAGILNFHPLW